MASDEPRPGSPSEADQLLLTWAREAPDGQARDIRLGERLHRRGAPGYSVPRVSLPWLLDEGRAGSRGESRRAAARAWDAAGRPLADDALLEADDPRRDARDEGWSWDAPDGWTEGPAVAVALLRQLAALGHHGRDHHRRTGLRVLLDGIQPPTPLKTCAENIAPDDGLLSEEARLAAARERLAPLRDMLAPAAWEAAVAFEAGVAMTCKETTCA